jgi:elongator complex protein 3
MGHPADKIELIVMGGTFPACPTDYQRSFIKACYDELNGVPSSSLEEAKKLNESARRRCVGLCIETRADWCGEEQIALMLEMGATRVEIGVQAIDEDIYHLVRRGHSLKAVIDASRRARCAGLKVYYHWMPGLPGSNPEHDLDMALRLFSDEQFQPDGLKLYPTLVVEGSELAQWYADGRYLPYLEAEMVDLLARIKAAVPPYTRIARLMRDIPTRFILAGCRDLSLRGKVKIRMKELGLVCRCIRCREYGHQRAAGRKTGIPALVRRDYRAAGGDEIFLSYEDSAETLFGLLRLRIQPGEEGQIDALVREIHVFGQEVPVGAREENTAQHKGLGEGLLKEAERISAGRGAGTIRVLAGVGARSYFREYGYTLRDAYMIKRLGPFNELP